MKIFAFRIFFFFLYTSALQAESVRLAPEAEPLALVHGCVNIITGEFVQKQTDLFVTGPSAISLERIYDSGLDAKTCLGHGFAWAVAQSLWCPSNNTVSLEERQGAPLYYTRKEANTFTVSQSAFQAGYTSYAPGQISGFHNLHNVSLFFNRNDSALFAESDWSPQ